MNMMKKLIAIESEYNGSNPSSRMIRFRKLSIAACIVSVIYFLLNKFNLPAISEAIYAIYLVIGILISLDFTKSIYSDNRMKLLRLLPITPKEIFSLSLLTTSFSIAYLLLFVITGSTIVLISVIMNSLTHYLIYLLYISSLICAIFFFENLLKDLINKYPGFAAIFILLYFNHQSMGLLYSENWPDEYGVENYMLDYLGFSLGFILLALLFILIQWIRLNCRKSFL